jgi:hypothetical protein
MVHFLSLKIVSLACLTSTPVAYTAQAPGIDAIFGVDSAASDARREVLRWRKATLCASL